MNHSCKIIIPYLNIVFYDWQLTLNNLPEAPSVVANFHLAR